jgi:hypothetical protein
MKPLVSEFGPEHGLAGNGRIKGALEMLDECTFQSSLETQDELATDAHLEKICSPSPNLFQREASPFSLA